MRLMRMAGDDSCNYGTCPMVFAIDERKDEAVVQGLTVTDAAVLAQLNLASGETAVRVPRTLLVDAAACLRDRP